MCLAVPGQVLELVVTAPLERTARVRFGTIVKEVSLVLLPEADVGHYVLVHAGIGIATVNEEEAARTYAYLQEIGELEEIQEDTA